VKGKNIAITRVGSSDYVIWKSIFQRIGLKESDVTFLNANTVPGQMALLQRGDAQVLSVSPPNNVLAERAGAHQIFDTVEANMPTQGNGMVVSRKVLAEKRPAFLNMTRASIEAIHRWKTDPAFSKEVIKKYLKESDQRFVDAGYEAYVPVFPKVPYPSRDGFEVVVEEVASQNPKAKDLKFEQLADVSLVKELEDIGFIKQVYGE
jgi:ABC-type nitrate/sulfonate/bicarbonate transport system substrate-binding protein